MSIDQIWGDPPFMIRAFLGDFMALPKGCGMKNIEGGVPHHSFNFQAMTLRLGMPPILFTIEVVLTF